MADAEPLGHVCYAERAPTIVYLILVLQDSRLFWVEAPALDSLLEEGSFLLVLLVATLHIDISVAGIVQSCKAPLALFLSTIIELWRQTRWTGVTRNRPNVRNWRSGREALLGQGRHLLIIGAINPCCVYMLELTALNQCVLEERRRWLALVAAWVSLQYLADTGKSTWHMHRRLMSSLDTLTKVHLASKLVWRKGLLLRAPIFDFWVFCGTHLGFWRLGLCVSFDEPNFLLFCES